MYICQENDGSNKELLKCQSWKNYMDIEDSMPMREWVKVEVGDLVPFKHTSVIDCDKKFRIDRVIIPEALIANKSIRKLPDIYFNEAASKSSQSAQKIAIDTSIFLAANNKCFLKE